MDAADALKDLTEISSQIEAAILISREGTTLASTIDDDARNERLLAAVQALVAAATADGGELVQLEAATSEGSLFVVRDDERDVAAVTKAEPTAGLVFFDLKSCLRAAAAEEGDGKPRPQARPRNKACRRGERVTFLRRLFGFATLAAVAAAAVFVLRRRAAGSRHRVDLYYEDGSMATFEAGDPAADELLNHARDALAAARVV